ncbi:MAG: hypothetical protein FJ272_21355, partial [Planctomycetes bacterium]|nr:hypothetical protein [Planctomycetota bacterium]
KLVAHRDVLHVVGDSDWQSATGGFKAEPGAVRVELKGGLWRATGQAWFDDFSLREIEPEIRLNTRRGEPHDSLRVSPHQIGVFDPSYRLKRVAYASASPGQTVFPDGVRLDGPLEGFAASGVLGYDNARWTSLLAAYDRYGRLRGSVGALMRHYRSPFRKSAWAFFGATNRDLFPTGDVPMSAAFARLAESMLRGAFLHNLTTNWASYDPGEEAQVSVQVSNFGWQPRQVAVRFALNPDIELPPQPLTVPPGETATAPASFRVPAKKAHFYRITASLHLGAQVIDQLEGGFVVRDERVVQSGPKLRWAYNYLECDGRARVLLGTDTYGSMFSSAQQSPLTWLRDVQKCQDFGVSVFENLQVNPTTFPKPYEADEKFLRQVDGLVQLCQAHRLVYLPCLLCGYNTVASDEELAKQAAYSEAFAKRYAKVPGIAYYVNGDLSFRWIDSPDIKRLWNDFLKQRYGTDERLREAWRLNPPEARLGDLPVAEPRPKGWADIRACDFHEFKIKLVERWIDAQHRACRRGDPEHPTTVEYYQLPHGGIDMRR